MKIAPALIPFLKEMREELDREELEVCLAPGDNPARLQNGCMIRSVMGQNPEWYRKLCAEHPNWNYPKRRKKRTMVKRKYIKEVLDCAIKNADSASKYAGTMVREAERRLVKQNAPPDEVDWRAEIYG